MRVLIWAAGVSVCLALVGCAASQARHRRGLEASLSSSDPVLRALSAEALGKTLDEGAVEPLIDSLTDEDAKVRAEAAEALTRITRQDLGENYEAWLAWHRTGSVKPPTATPVLPASVPPPVAQAADQAQETGNSEKEAVKRLVDAGAAAVPSLLQSLGDPSPQTRSIAINALALIGDPQCIEPIADRLARDVDPAVRVKAAGAMGLLAGPVAQDALLKALSDPDPEVRYYSATALRWAGDAKAIGPLIQALQDREGMVSGRALMVLKYLSGQDLGADPAGWQEWYVRSKDQDKGAR